MALLVGVNTLGNSNNLTNNVCVSINNSNKSIVHVKVNTLIYLVVVLVWLFGVLI